MEEQKQLSEGMWDKLGEPDPNQIKFEMNKPVVVVLRDDKPEEIKWKDGVYYRFHTTDGKFFNTSAMTLLHGMKKLMPLKSKKVSIVKKIINGLQIYDVTEVK